DVRARGSSNQRATSSGRRTSKGMEEASESSGQGCIHKELYPARARGIRMKQARLDRHHYASKWKVPDVDNFYDVSEVNALGQKYATSLGPEKEAHLLELIKKFHTYLMKYLNMIVRGH